MLSKNNNRLHCPKQIEDKFVWKGKSYSVHVKGEEEIRKLEEYLNFDFLDYESQKLPSKTSIYNPKTTYIVSCFYKESVLVNYKGEMMSYLLDYDKILSESLPLDVFLNPEDNYSFFWYYALKNKK